MESQLYTYRAEVLKYTDGDTVHFMVDKGFDTFHQIVARLARINAPESNRKKSMVKGKAATKYLIQLLESRDADTKLIVKSMKQPTEEDENKLFDDSFGRWILEIWVCLCGNWVNVNDIMVATGHAIYQDY